MTRIDDIFAAMRAEGRTALMPFVTAGYPSLDVTARTIPALAEAGASIIELGIPFSDPIADGPVIAASMHEALVAGVTPAAVWKMVRGIRAECDLGLIAMVSHSIVSRGGAERFVDAAAEAGMDGLIIPDIDLAEAREVGAMAEARSMSFSLLVAPTTTAARAEQVVATCRGFVYLLARAGITGESGAAPDIDARVAELREMTDLPIAVGFGISAPEHVRAVTRSADAAIVGSALVRRMGGATDPVAAAGDLVRELATGLVVDRARNGA